MGRPSSRPKKFHCCGLSWVARSGLHYHKVKHHGYKPDSRRGRRKNLIKQSEKLIAEVDAFLGETALEELFEEYYTGNEEVMFDPDDFFL